MFSFARWLLPLQLVTGLDMGYLPEVANIDPKKAESSLKLMSMVCGCRYHISWLGLDFTYAKPLYISKHLTIPKNAYQVIFSFTVKLHGLFS